MVPKLLVKIANGGLVDSGLVDSGLAIDSSNPPVPHRLVSGVELLPYPLLPKLVDNKNTSVFFNPQICSV